MSVHYGEADRVLSNLQDHLRFPTASALLALAEEVRRLREKVGCECCKEDAFWGLHRPNCPEGKVR